MIIAEEPVVHRYLYAEMTADQRKAQDNLLAEVWPTAPSLPNTPDAQKRDLICFVIWDGKTAVATSQVFTRVIKTEEGELTALCLASVCVKPNLQGKGLGKRVVVAALKELGMNGTKVAFWQTARAGFYEKLGARCVENRFMNSQDPVDPARNPFWDPEMMVYPSDAAWPEGVIDIRGPGF